MDDDSTESLRSMLGARVAYEWILNDKITLLPEVRALWQHDFLNGSESIRAGFNGGRGANFQYQTKARDRDALYFGAGVGAKFGDRLYGNFYYHIDFGREESNHAFSVSATFKF